MERISRLSGTLTSCACERQPMHVERRGYGGTHWLECPPCGTRTPRFPSLNEAVEAWERAEYSPLRTR
jgi:hypothetical protein